MLAAIVRKLILGQSIMVLLACCETDACHFQLAKAMLAFQSHCNIDSAR